MNRYFQAVEVKMTTTPKTAHKTVVALKWCTYHCKHIGKKFLIESESVTLYLKTQIANKVMNMAAIGNGTDPNKGLKDLHPQPDREKILLHHIWQSY
jgi:hypothetical protein